MKIDHHECNFRVYYEDTDAGGVVYYANYLKFAERARTEMLRSLQIVQSDLAEKDGMYFVVRRAALDLRAPARLDDLLSVESHIVEMKGAAITMEQEVLRGKTLLARVGVEIACVGKDFKPLRLLARMKEVLGLYCQTAKA